MMKGLGYYEITFRSNLSLEAMLKKVQETREDWVPKVGNFQEAYREVRINCKYSSPIAINIRNGHVPKNNHGHNYLAQIFINDDRRFKDEEILETDVYSLFDTFGAEYNKSEYPGSTRGSWLEFPSKVFGGCK